MTTLSVGPVVILHSKRDIHDEALPFLRRKESKNKWQSSRVAKQFRNRQSRSNKVQHHHRQKRHFHKSQMALKGVVPAQLCKNRKHRRRLGTDSLMQSHVNDLLDTSQLALENTLSECMDGLAGDEAMIYNKNLLVLDSPKRRWRRKKQHSTPKTSACTPSPNSSSKSKSETFHIISGSNSMSSFSLSEASASPAGGSEPVSAPTQTLTKAHLKQLKSQYKYESVTKYQLDDESSECAPDIFESDSESDSCSSVDFIANYFENYSDDGEESEPEQQLQQSQQSVKKVQAAQKKNEEVEVGIDVDAELRALQALDEFDEKEAELAEEMQKKYIKAMEDIEELGQYAPIAGLAERCSYKEYNKNDESTQMDPKTMKRVFNEIRQDLPKNLTLQWNGSMFVRFDEENPRFLQALLTGLEDTPYQNGMFAFDIYLQKEYPNSPLKIKHVTKGGTLVHGSHTPGGFSPNLHRDSGKVCLSLLGTWGTNQWDAKTSNIYQVLSSILWMIFGAQWAYYMEPSYGGWEGTCQMNEKDASKHKKEVVTYNYEVIEKCMKYAMLETIKKPYEGFEEVIKTHFKLKKREILTCVLDKWIRGAPNDTMKKKLSALYKELKQELEGLK